MALAPSSPRLPSPPPPAEIQMTPNSPSGGPASSPQEVQLEQSLLDASSKRRIHPGTKSADMAAGPPLVPLQELDSPFQLQEHLSALHYHHTGNGTKPIDREAALQLAEPPAGIDRTLWLYELCRFLISQCNSLIVGFLFDTPACSASTCPEMRASEWQFLCAVHEQPKSCCAIDYCCHTLDWAANVVTDQKLFPSRFVVMSDAHSKNVGVKNLINVFRRLHRIFAHAWFQHRSVFWSVENQTGLYVFFKSVCDRYDLLPAENYKLPPEAEGLETPSPDPIPERPQPTILKPPSQQQLAASGEDDNSAAGRSNTRRHIRSSPSTGSAVTTVIEADEEETDGVTQRVRELHISAPETVEEEPEVAEVPVIVEQSVIDSAASSEAGRRHESGAEASTEETGKATGADPNGSEDKVIAGQPSNSASSETPSNEAPSSADSTDMPATESASDEVDAPAETTESKPSEESQTTPAETSTAADEDASAKDPKKDEAESKADDTDSKEDAK